MTQDYPILSHEEVDAINMVNVMGIDLWQHMNLSNDHGDTEPKRRAAVRAGFSVIEGVLWAFRQAALSRARRGLLELTAVESLGLQERTVRGKSKPGEVGFIESQGHRLKASEALVISTCYFARAYSIPFLHPKDVGNQGFVDYQSALEIRHRITHPKSIEEFKISKADYDRACRSIGWAAGYLATHFDAALHVLWPNGGGVAPITEWVARHGPAVGS